MSPRKGDLAHFGAICVSRSLRPRSTVKPHRRKGWPASARGSRPSGCRKRRGAEAKKEAAHCVCGGMVAAWTNSRLGGCGVADGLSSFATTLISVVVGGVLTMAGGWLVEWRKQIADKKRHRSQKFEELVAAVYEFDRWLDNTKNVAAFGEKIDPGLSPLAKIHAIAAVYFPQFTQLISELNAPIARYRLWMAEAGQKRLAGNPTIDGFQEAYGAYNNKRDELLKALTEFAGREFQ